MKLSSNCNWSRLLWHTPEMKAGEGREREGPGHGTPGGKHGLNVEELAVATGLRYTEGRGKEIGINGA